MIKLIALLVVLGGIGAVAASQAPEMKRYLKMRNM